MGKLTKLKMNSFENIHEIDKSMVRLILEERKQSQLTDIRSERGDPADTIWIINYYKQFPVDTFDDIFKMDKFLERYHLPKLTQEGIAKNILNEMLETVIAIWVCQNFLILK